MGLVRSACRHKAERRIRSWLAQLASPVGANYPTCQVAKPIILSTSNSQLASRGRSWLRDDGCAGTSDTRSTPGGGGARPGAVVSRRSCISVGGARGDLARECENPQHGCGSPHPKPDASLANLAPTSLARGPRWSLGCAAQRAESCPAKAAPLWYTGRPSKTVEAPARDAARAAASRRR